jgi:hypothetical protein
VTHSAGPRGAGALSITVCDPRRGNRRRLADHRAYARIGRVLHTSSHDRHVGPAAHHALVVSLLAARCARARFHLPVDVLATGLTALQAYGIDLGDDSVLRMVTATPAQTRRPGVRLTRVARLPPHAAGLVAPLPAWGAAALDLDLVDLVAAGDALLRRELCTLAELTAFAEGATGRGCRALRRAASLVREREHDGDQHRDREHWNTDLDRDDASAEADFATIRVTRDRMRRPRQLVHKIHARLVERGYDGPPPTFTPEWVALFEHRV